MPWQMARDAAADRRARLECVALELAFDADALVQLGPEAAPRIAELRVAAAMLRRELLALAWELGEGRGDPVRAGRA